MTTMGAQPLLVMIHHNRPDLTRLALASLIGIFWRLTVVAVGFPEASQPTSWRVTKGSNLGAGTGSLGAVDSRQNAALGVMTPNNSPAKKTFHKLPPNLFLMAVLLKK